MDELCFRSQSQNTHVDSISELPLFSLHLPAGRPHLWPKREPNILSITAAMQMIGP